MNNLVQFLLSYTVVQKKVSSRVKDKNVLFFFNFNSRKVDSRKVDSRKVDSRKVDSPYLNIRNI
jgi:hypothetical protein